MPGEGIASRIGASMASAFGLNPLIARDLEDYGQLAVRLARLPEALKRLRKQTYEAVRFDEAIYAERLERYAHAYPKY
jgi:predicted O-linked N-acetylglucosamine transferase (SPINDLY family)